MSALRAIVTRPAAQAAGWVQALRALGVEAHALPLLAIEPLDDPAPLRAAWATLHERALVMFVSANAVQQFFAQCEGRPWPGGVRAGSTGPGTSQALRRAGVHESLLDEPAADAPAFDSEALWRRLSPLDWRGRRVLVVRGTEGRDWLADTLRAAGAQVEFVAAYRRAAPRLDAPAAALLQRALAEPEAHLWLLSSSEALRHLGALAPGADWSRARAAATHPRIAASARAAGFGQVLDVAPTPKAAAALIAELATEDRPAPGVPRPGTEASDEGDR